MDETNFSTEFYATKYIKEHDTYIANFYSSKLVAGLCLEFLRDPEKPLIIQCPICKLYNLEEGETHCPTCLREMKKAKELLAKFNQTTSKAKPKPKIGERKIQTDA